MSARVVFSRRRRLREAFMCSPALVGVAAALVCFSTLAAESRRPTNAEVLFRLAHPCPSTGETHGRCAGYVIDRIIPVACGGAEDPGNMQWQTIAEAKEKDRWEKIGCRRGRKLVLPGESRSVTEAFAVDERPAPVEAQPLPAEGGAGK